MSLWSFSAVFGVKAACLKTRFLLCINSDKAASSEMKRFGPRRSRKGFGVGGNGAAIQNGRRGIRLRVLPR